MGNAHSRRVRAPRTLAENGIGNGPQETSVNTTAKTPAEPTPPQAHDQLPFADMNAAFVNFDTFDIVYKQTMKYLDPKDADTDSDYSADDRDDDFDGVDWNHDSDNDYDLNMHEPGDQPALLYFLLLLYCTISML